jgi:para-aminobenzoate synthetase / 4-amino-4-deoxychorismate lyase
VLVRCRIDHAAAGAEAIELQHAIGTVEARRTSEIPAVLAEAEAAARRGCFAAGFVAYDAAPAFDPAFRVPLPNSEARAEATLPLAWFGLFGEAVPAPPLPPVVAGASPGGAGDTGWDCEVDAPAHAAGVAAIRGAIAEGDAYLVNYTTRFRRHWGPDDDPLELYCRLVASYGGGYHAYFENEDWAVVCGSPELFFEHSSGVLTTRPMKGTAPRGRWVSEDARLGETLRTSPKERAENVMVVDLLRNDLGRIAATGSVEVPALWCLEQHPTLWQLTSTVTASTPPAVGLADVFGALFPCASVTGAPKISAMSIIADLEPSARGLYCGAVGLLEPSSRGLRPRRHPTARFAVAIRTAVVDKVRGHAEYGSGGGITWDSDERPEWAEVRLKAGALVGPAVPSLGPDDGLIETMAFDPDLPDVPVRSVRNLGAHLARLAASARYFGLAVPPEIEELVAKAVAGLDTPTRVRLLLRSGGTVEVPTSPMETGVPSTPLRLCVDSQPVDSTEVTLFHKTTDRRRYDERARRHPAADDVVLVNERSEVTETTRANLAVRLAGRWCTPPLRSGLLPGVERARRLAEGQLVERVVTVDDLRAASAVAVLSSLRGWRAALVVADCPC